MNFPQLYPVAVQSDADLGFVHVLGPSVEPDPEREGSQDASDNVTPEPAKKKRRIIRACDQCRPGHLKCSGYMPCHTCSAKKKKCTYNLPVRGREVPPAPPPPPPGEEFQEVPRNVVAPRLDTDGNEINYNKWKYWSRRVCVACRDAGSVCTGLVPCANCFASRIECIYPERRPHPNAAENAVGAETAENVQETAEEQAAENRARMRLAYSPDIEDLQLSAQYADETTPPQAFLHRAWTRLAQAYYPTPSHNPQMPPPPMDPKTLELSLSRDDLPFDRSAHLHFPPRPVWFALQENFFNSWMSTFHFLHRFTVSTWLDLVGKNAKQGFELWRGLGHGRCAIALMTMALGTFEKISLPPKSQRTPEEANIDPNIPPVLGDQIFSLALSISDAAPAPPKLDVIQATLLQDIYLLCTCRMNQAYFSFGNTMQMITSLGLHRRLGRNRGLGRDVKRFPDYPKIQCERRTFWSAYVIDKELSMIFGQPTRFSEDTIDQLLPDCINDEDMRREGPIRAIKSDCYVSALVAHAELGKLMDKILREVYTLQDRPDEERIVSAVLLSKEVEGWRLCLPPHLSAFQALSLLPIFRRQSTLLRIAYYHALILATRPFLLHDFPMEISERKQFHSQQITKCVDACIACLQAINAVACGRDCLQFQSLFYAHHVAFIAASALCVVPVTRARQMAAPGRKRSYQSTDKRSMELVDMAIGFLKEGANPHCVSRRYALILEEMKIESIKHTPKPVTDDDEEEEEVRREETPPEDYYSFYPENTGTQENGADENGNAGSNSGQPAQPVQFEFVHERPDAPDPNEPAPGRKRQPQMRPPELTLWEKWKITDWVDLDSAAYGPILSFLSN
ncbi:Fungal specific transcription factor domain containing protein [Naviculisporaceae sp. PSN 640]